jgi:hypothetical protein
MYKVYILLFAILHPKCNHFFIFFLDFTTYFVFKYWFVFFFFFCLQWEISLVANVVIRLYYEEVFDPTKRSIAKLQEHMVKVMEQVKKDHYLTFCKHLLVCDPALGPIFFWMRFKLIMIWTQNQKCSWKSSQVLAYCCVTPQQKLSWLKWWNESNVLKEANIFPKQGFSNQQFDKWQHKASFEHQVWFFPLFALLCWTLLLIVNPFNCFMQLEAKALKLYTIIVMDFELIVHDFPKVISFSSYIQEWW